MFWFGFWIFVVVAAIVGASVLIGKALSGPKQQLDSRRQRDITALKASGALSHRKSNR